MAKPRQIISYIDLYKAFYEKKLAQLCQEFGEKVVEVAVNNYLVSIVIIIEKYHCWRSAVDCLKAIPFIKYYVFEASDEELSNISKEVHTTFQYRCIREFIFKDKKGILAAFKRKCPPPDDLDRYIEIFSEMARECVEFCLEKFRGEIDSIREMEKEEVFEAMLERRLECAADNKDKLKAAAEIKRGERKSFVENLQKERGENSACIGEDENFAGNNQKVKWLC